MGRMDLVDWQAWWKRSGARELNDLLWTRWDPIGWPARGEDAAFKPPEDEYASYAGVVGRMLREGAEAADIAASLRRIEVESMGLADVGDRTDVADEASRGTRVRWGRTAPERPAFPG